MSDLCKRKSARLKNYDYSTPGAYFVTICAYKRKEIFSQIVGAIHESPENVLTAYGEIVNGVISKLPEKFDIEIPKYVIMPNHIHLIVQINDNIAERAIRESPLHSRHSVLSNVVGYLKMNASKQIHLMSPETVAWQRSYHDHIIRGEADYKKIWEYINSNVIQWEKDCFYCK
ncbi:MAG: transposase [Clostridia bacterium]|nr:transposase [Clostridia bacterium]